MAHFKSTVTNYGAQVLAEIIAGGGTLTITAARAGDGRYTGNPAEIVNLVNPLDVQVDLGELTYIEGSGIVWIPVQITNQGLTSAITIREIALYSAYGGESFIFGYCWVDGSDTDNTLEPSLSDDSADAVHIQDVGLFVTNQEASAITVQVGGGSYISREELFVYAAQKEHTHMASEVSETTGENVEVVQRRQDYDIAALKEQLDTGFVGTTLTHTVQAAELDEWTGYDGTGYPEGIYDAEIARLYA